VEPSDGGPDAGGSRPSAVGGDHEGNSGRRILWKDDEQLWEVALFDKMESVLSFSEHIANSTDDVAMQPAAPGACARFQAAVRNEHAEEKKLVREALAGH